jgi:hypothetical protein
MVETMEENIVEQFHSRWILAESKAGRTGVAAKIEIDYPKLAIGGNQKIDSRYTAITGPDRFLHDLTPHSFHFWRSAGRSINPVPVDVPVRGQFVFRATEIINLSRIGRSELHAEDSLRHLVFFQHQCFGSRKITQSPPPVVRTAANAHIRSASRSHGTGSLEHLGPCVRLFMARLCGKNRASRQKAASRHPFFETGLIIQASEQDGRNMTGTKITPGLNKSPKVCDGRSIGSS